MVYKIDIAEKIEKRLEKLPKKEKERIIEKINSLAKDPRPEGCKRLQGNRKPHLYGVRSGDYRIIYAIEDKFLIVLIVEVGNRKEVYRNF